MIKLIKDPDNYLRIRTKNGSKINTLAICPLRSKPQTEEGLKDADYKYPALIYRVDSRHEFDNCQAEAANIVAVVECDDRPKESRMGEIFVNVNVLLDEFEEKKKYFFLSVSSDRSRDRVCDDDSVLRFSITIDSNADQYLKVSENTSDFSYKIISLVLCIILILIFLVVILLSYN